MISRTALKRIALVWALAVVAWVLYAFAWGFLTPDLLPRGIAFITSLMLGMTAIIVIAEGMQ